MNTLRTYRNNLATIISNATYYALDDITPLPIKTVAKPYRPIEMVTLDTDYPGGQLEPGVPRVTVTGLALDELILTRQTKEPTMTLRIFVEGLATMIDDDYVDTMIGLVEQVMFTCSSQGGWRRNESIRDEHGMPFLFHIAREKDIFQAIFHTVYFSEVPRKPKGS